MPRIAALLIFLSFIVAIEWYVFTGIAPVFHNSQWFSYTYWFLIVAMVMGFFRVFQEFSQKDSSQVRSGFSNFLMGFGFAVIVMIIVLAGLLLLQDIILLIYGFLGYIWSAFTSSTFEFPTRNLLALKITTILALIPFASMIYGTIFGKYRFEVEKIKLNFPDLPKAFEGFKILHISDIHAGSFDSIKQVEKGVDMIRKQAADMIVFTGDLVNTLKDEINPYLEAFSKLNAPYGMFSILGNHDYYGLYRVAQNDPVAQQSYMKDFAQKQKEIGFQLLMNESLKIEKGADSIRLLGVENWGAGPFPKRGDLDRALQGVENDEFTILMSHDPTHWDHHVLPHNKHVHLTLAGHTHGMQFGINLPKFKWSPVKYRYKRWMGLYEKAGQYLYVNRGFGFLAWPGRVGMSPEITVIELSSN